MQPTAVVDDNGNIWVTWQSYENGNADVMAKYYNGSTWSDAEVVAESSLFEGNPCLSKAPFGAYRVMLFWDAKQNDTNNIYYAWGNYSGWTPEPMPLTNDSTNNTNPVAVYNDVTQKIELVWTYENDNTLRIREANYSQSNGWTQPIDLFETIFPTQKIFLPKLSVKDGQTFLTFTVEDNVKNVHFYKIESGDHWVVTGSDIDQWQSDITFIGDDIYCFWQNNQAGNNDIYYDVFFDTDVDNYPAPEGKISLQSYPNPILIDRTKSRNTVIFRVFFDKEVTKNLNEMELQVFNIKGQLVKVIPYTDFIEKKDGVFVTNWNVKDANGKSLSSGLYLYKLKCGNMSETKKMLIVR